MTYRNHPDWLLLLGLSAVLVLQACDGSRQESKPSETKAVAVTILALHAVPLEQIYEAAGAVRARQRAVLASKLQATVLSVTVKLGDAVRPGQLLMELDHSETDAEFQRGQGALVAAESGTRQAEKGQAAAEAEANLAAITLGRFQQLLDKKSVSQQELDQADARNKTAQAALGIATARVEEATAQQDAARAALEAARIRQGYTRITAPFAGFVAEKYADAGSVVSPGMPLVTVEDSAGYQFEVALPESRIEAVKLGDTVQVSIPSISLEAPARIEEMQPGAEAGSRSSLVRMALPARAGLRSGLFGRARFSLGTADGLAVPENVILRQGELRYVYVVAEGKARKRLVTIGRVDGGTAEVLSGLEEGEQIAISSLGSLADGAPVEIQP